MRQLVQVQDLAASGPEVWDFFCDPRNLDELTPPGLRFTILGDPPPMFPGQLIAYRIRVPPGLPMRWLTEIRLVEPGRRFIDEQRLGPYRLWYHEHRFDPLPGGGLRMTDTVTYDVGWGILGPPIERWYVSRQVAAIFAFRRQAVARRFGGPG